VLQTLYLTLEKRYNFSLDDRAVVANGYSNFRAKFDDVSSSEGGPGSQCEGPEKGEPSYIQNCGHFEVEMKKPRRTSKVRKQVKTLQTFSSRASSLLAPESWTSNEISSSRVRREKYSSDPGQYGQALMDLFIGVHRSFGATQRLGYHKSVRASLCHILWFLDTLPGN
jgi:hypothetical protein